eukprot:TRINITY_DN6120_c0_g1_i1.p1 TRINITY_DN6120_c0_g1~~TRINITY_DN6120_c0_g1_i1.p1  ORF type:complete len:280 (+),score=21.34 TRINITY_DN6120_c0_g1_i1:265-1104(+)
MLLLLTFMWARARKELILNIVYRHVDAGISMVNLFSEAHFPKPGALDTHNLFLAKFFPNGGECEPPSLKECFDIPDSLNETINEWTINLLALVFNDDTKTYTIVPRVRKSILIEQLFLNLEWAACKAQSNDGLESYRAHGLKWLRLFVNSTEGYAAIRAAEFLCYSDPRKAKHLLDMAQFCYIVPEALMELVHRIYAFIADNSSSELGRSPSTSAESSPFASPRFSRSAKTVRGKSPGRQRSTTAPAALEPQPPTTTTTTTTATATASPAEAPTPPEPV